MNVRKIKHSRISKVFSRIDLGCLVLFTICSAAWLAFYWFTAQAKQREGFQWVVMAQLAIGLILFFIGFFKKTGSSTDYNARTHDEQ